MGLFLALLQALALITAPVEGSTVAGTVTITGTAASPGFDHYELAFAYDPNPTDNWFEIVPPSNTPVTNGPLGAWDTTGITDGVYMLRLRVFNSGSKTPVDVIVRGIRVSNDAPTPTSPPPPGAATAAPASSPAPSLAAPTAAPTATPHPAAGAGTAGPATSGGAATAAPAALPAFLDLSPYSSAFCNGVIFTGGLFGLMGVYAVLRDRIRRPIRKWLRRVVSDSRKP